MDRFSRRVFLGRTAAMGGLGATIDWTCAGPAAAQGRVPKAAAEYQDRPKADQHCALCVNFVAPDSCRIVQGTISPNGGCRFFARKSG